MPDPPPHTMPDPPAIEGYTDLVPIGRGGLGDVYRAIQTATGAEVAIKVLRDVSDSSVAWHRTRRELNALLALSGHAHVVQIVELLDLPSGPALVMECAAGGSVADLLRDRDGTLTVDETVFVGRQTAAALVSAHARGIVHRDIKPQNLLIDADGQVQLCDFGIAALTRDDEYRGRTNAISMRYASPEDLEQHDLQQHDIEQHDRGDAGSPDDSAVGPASDVYSLGATLLHIARGAPPTLRERLAPWSPPDTGDAHLAALDRVIARCLHPVPTMRPTAQELVDALDGLALGAGICRVTALPVVDRTAAPSPPADRDAVEPTPGYGPTRPPERRVHRWTVAPEADPDADTVARLPPGSDPEPEHARPADPPRPVPTGPRWHRPALLIVAALAVAGTTIVLWPSDDAAAPGPPTVPVADAPEFHESPTSASVPSGVVTLPRPEGLVALTDPEVVWNLGDVGDCLAQMPAAAELTVVHCDDPHDLQRYAAGSVVDLGIAADAAFDQQMIVAAVTAACSSSFEAFVGAAPAGSSLQTAQTRPNAATWAEGDREYHCYLGVEGVRLIGDARDTGW